jgi:Domain of unknown function (DUF4349)/Putative zinc-finger
MNSSTHPFQQEEVMAYLDGELTADRASTIAAHLRECAECAALAQELRETSSTLANWSVEPSPASLTENIQAAATVQSQQSIKRIEAKKGLITRFRQFFPGIPFPQLRKRWVLGVAGASALAVLVLAVGLSVIHYGRERDRLEVYSKAEPNTPANGRNVESLQHLDTLQQQRDSQSNNLEFTESLGAATKSSAGARGIMGGSGGGYAPAPIPPPQSSQPQSSQPQSSQPMIAKTASLTIDVKDFGPVEANVRAIAQRYKGYIASLTSTSPQDSGRALSASLRIPSPQLEAAIADLKRMGHVEQETESGEEVTKEFVDREARLSNARATEQRLLNVLRDHTGKVSDILQAEQEIARVRGDIEQMQADQRALQTRVDFASVDLSAQEEYKATLETTPPSTGTRLRNAAVEGYRAAVESVIGFGVWILEDVPALILWSLALFFPLRWMWRKARRRPALQN